LLLLCLTAWSVGAWRLDVCTGVSNRLGWCLMYYVPDVGRVGPDPAKVAKVNAGR